MKFFIVSVVFISCFLTNSQSVRFLVSKDQEVCLYENLPKNEALKTQVIVEEGAKDFEIQIIHLNEKGKTIESRKTLALNSLDTIVHQEDTPIYVCVLSNTTQKIAVELIPNLVLPDQSTIPSADDADMLQRNLFVTNSRFMELINEQKDFEQKEQEGLEANLRVEKGLKNMMFLELLVIVVIGIGQYFIMRAFVNKIKKM